MIKTLIINRKDRSDRESKLISQYLNQRGFISSVVISRELGKNKADSRKVTNLMDRLRDYVLSAGSCTPALAVQQDGFVKYWYPARRVNEYLACLGVSKIEIDYSKLGEYQYDWFDRFLFSGRRMLSIEHIEDSVKRSSFKKKILNL